MSAAASTARLSTSTAGPGISAMASLDRAADGQMAGEVGMGGHGFSDGGNVLLRSAGSAGCTTKRYEPAHKITRRHVAPAPRDPESIGVPTRVLPVPPRKVHIKDVIEYKKRFGMKPRWVIDPRHSKAMQVWDVVIVSVLLFTALVTPVEVSFLPPPETASDPLFLINRLVDALFIGDLCLQFVLMYPEESREGARWVFTPSRIWWHYLTGWFLIDFVSIVVSTFDYISISATAKEGSTATLTGALLNTSSAAGGAETGQAAALSTVAKLKALRVLRVLRLIKLLRLLRMSRIFKRWETRAAIDYSLMALMKVFTMLLLWAHLCACLWTLQTDLFFPNRYETWLGEAGEGLCVARLSEDGGTLEDACRSPGELYVASLYWSVMTITSIGYGDISATRWPEQVVAICVMLLGSILWGQVIGTIVSTISTFNPEATEFRRTMDDLNRFLRLNGLAPEVRQRLREYFHQTKHLRLTLANRHLLQQMSPQLQGEVAYRIHGPWLNRVSFLHGAEYAFIVQLALHLSPMVFSPGELATVGYLYIVHRGIALYGGKVLTTGKVWGEDMILFNMSLQRTWCARAMNYLEVLMLSRDRLVLIYDQFPATEKIIKRQAMFLALRRYIIAAATKLVEKGQAKGSFTRKKSFSLDAALTAASSRAMSMGEQSMSHAALSCSQATLQRSSSVETLPVASTPAVGHDDQTTAKLLGEMASVKNEVAELKGMVALLLSRGGGDASEPPTN